MKRVPLSEAKAKLSEFVDEVRRMRDPIIIQKRNSPAAVLLEMETFERLQKLEDRLRSIQLREALKGRKRPLRQVLSALEL